MATGTMESYDLVGRKEDVSGIISNISPTKTPFQSVTGSEGIHNILHQWQEDSLIAAAANSVVEGANAPVATWQATNLRTNNTQILTKTASASGTADVVKKYGRDKELAYQMGLRSAELKRDLEKAFVGTGQVAVIGNDTTARVMAGFQAQILTPTTFVAGVGAGLGFTGATPASAAITEAAVLAVAQQLYTNGIDPSMLMVKPADAPKIAAFQIATGRTKYIDNADKKVVNVVDVYECAFGNLKVVLNRFIRGAQPGDTVSDALVFDPDMWKKLVLRAWFRQMLAKVGDSTQMQILGEYSLKHKNFGASGLITNLS